MFCWENPPPDHLPTCSNPRHLQHDDRRGWTRPSAAIRLKPRAVDAAICPIKDHRRLKLPQRWRQQRFYPSYYIRPLPKSTNVTNEDFDGFTSLVDDNNGVLGGKSSIQSSSEGEESDGELFTNPTGELDLPTSLRDRADSTEAAFTVTAHRLGALHRWGGKRGYPSGTLINIGLLAFLSVFLLFMDWCSWRMVRLPLEPFYLTRPFFIASILSAIAGYIYVPILKMTNMYQTVRKEGPASHLYKSGTPTMGGLFFIPIGIIVANVITGSPVEVSGAALSTFAFGIIGFIDDSLKATKSHSCGLPGEVKFLLQAAAAICFSFWLGSAKISTPYSMKFLVPLPSPLGLIYIGKLYMVLTSFCFVSMANGVNITDGLDGLAAGTTALAFSAMSVAVLPICPDLSIFGVSLAGACLGFLCHNRYKASVFMGDTGSLALGSALAAMASCTGMFFPLFVSSGIFVLEVLSVIVQVLYFKVTKYFFRAGQRFFLMAPLHHHLELCGLAQPVIVMAAYLVSCLLSLMAAYIGLVSA